MRPSGTCDFKRKGGELGSLPAFASPIVQLEVGFKAELERARRTQTEHARPESNKVAAASGSRSVIDRARAAINRRVQKGVGSVVVLPVEQVEESDFWPQTQNPHFFPHKPYSPP